MEPVDEWYEIVRYFANGRKTVVNRIDAGTQPARFPTQDEAETALERQRAERNGHDLHLHRLQVDRVEVDR